MRSRVFRAIVPWVGVCAAPLFAGVGVLPQATVPSREEAVAIALQLVTRTPSYAATGADAMTFLPESLELMVTLRNVTSAPVSIGSAGESWADQLVVSLETLDASPAMLVNSGNVVRRVEPASSNSRNELAPGSQVFARYAPLTAESTPLSAGRYRATVSVAAKALGTGTRSVPLRRDLVFEVRVPRTREERIDYFLELAFRAMLNGSQPDVRVAAHEALLLHPESVAALTEIGASFLREGNCLQAVPMLERAVSLLETGGDPLVRLGGSGRVHLAHELRGRIAASCLHATLRQAAGPAATFQRTRLTL